MVTWCERCNQRIIHARQNTDFVHACRSESNSPTIDQEDVVVVGDHVDFDGSGVRTKFEVAYAGTVNELEGTVGWLEGEDFDGVTARGNRKPTHRQRRFLHYKQFKIQ